MKNRWRQSIGMAFSLALFAVLELWLQKVGGISFTAELLKGSIMPVVVFAAGCVIGMAWEYVGQFALDWWHYPTVNRHRWLFALLPLFWGLFMLIMQDGYAVARVEGLTPLVAIVVSTLIIGLLIEAINLFTHSWIYTGRTSSPVYLALGWLTFLSYTFVVGFNTYFINPFGF